jgi:hypothetical protein
MAIDTLEEPAEPVSFVEAARLHAAVKEELAAIVASPSFSNSKKSCEFLQYIVQVTLDGRVDSLKERSIGLDLLGRDTSYDPSSDATVRVRANDVRKRLKFFYSTQTPKSGYQIELLPGSYSPRFTYVTIQIEAPQLAPLAIMPDPQKRVPEPQSIVPPVNLVGIMWPTFVAIFICALFLRQQIMSGDPYHQFWNTRLQGKKAMIIAGETSGSTAISNENLRIIMPIIWLAGRYDLKPVINEHNPQNEPRPDDLENYAVTIHTSRTTPNEFDDDKRLRYLIADSAGSLRLVDQLNPTQTLPLKGAVLTVLPEHPGMLWIAGTDRDSIHKLAEIITSKDSFPAELNEDATAGHVVQAVLRDSSLHMELYAY